MIAGIWIFASYPFASMASVIGSSFGKFLSISLPLGIGPK